MMRDARAALIECGCDEVLAIKGGAMLVGEVLRPAPPPRGRSEREPRSAGAQRSLAAGKRSGTLQMASEEGDDFLAELRCEKGIASVTGA